VNPAHELLNQRVLAATDLSAVGSRAVRLGAFLAQSWSSPLHVLHVLAEEGKGEDQARASIQAALDEGEWTAPELHLHLENGRPSERILASVDELVPDVLAMGSVSRSGIPGFLIGNTAERVLDALECSLLTIKPLEFESPVS
jgi:nucleotide-binding universal stress UspA family protein